MTVGVIGGGQLARMLALAGHPLGVSLVVLDPAEDACAAPVARHLRGAYDDAAMLARLADQCDVLTYEFENVPVHGLEKIEERVVVRPVTRALAAAQDRLVEKKLFQALGIPTAAFEGVQSAEEARAAHGRLGGATVVKTRRHGYDGKGQARVAEDGDAGAAWESLGGVPCIIESLVDFTREVSIVAARGPDGGMVHWPLSENVHHHGILHTSRARPGDPREDQAREHAKRLLNHFGYEGVIALECFEVEGELYANEFAPRVHNSGHWTIEGAETSQFENHLRAVLGWPLGRTGARGHVGMVNLIGEAPAQGAVLDVPGAHLHLYGKMPRPGRKLGHVTVVADDAEALEKAMSRLEALHRPVLAAT